MNLCWMENEIYCIQKLYLLYTLFYSGPAPEQRETLQISFATLFFDNFGKKRQFYNNNNLVRSKTLMIKYVSFEKSSKIKLQYDKKYWKFHKWIPVPDFVSAKLYKDD